MCPTAKQKPGKGWKGRGTRGMPREATISHPTSSSKKVSPKPNIFLSKVGGGETRGMTREAMRSSEQSGRATRDTLLVSCPLHSSIESDQQFLSGKRFSIEGWRGGERPGGYRSVEQFGSATRKIPLVSAALHSSLESDQKCLTAKNNILAKVGGGATRRMSREAMRSSEQSGSVYVTASALCPPHRLGCRVEDTES